MIFITSTLCLVFLLDHYEALFFSLMTFLLFLPPDLHSSAPNAAVRFFLIDNKKKPINIIFFALLAFTREEKQLPVS
jgi:hypothetical protein